MEVQPNFWSYFNPNNESFNKYKFSELSVPQKIATVFCSLIGLIGFGIGALAAYRLCLKSFYKIKIGTESTPPSATKTHEVATRKSIVPPRASQEQVQPKVSVSQEKPLQMVVPEIRKKSIEASPQEVESRRSSISQKSDVEEEESEENEEFGLADMTLKESDLEELRLTEEEMEEFPETTFIFEREAVPGAVKKEKFLTKMEQFLSRSNEVLGKAIDNGDCFYDSVAQGLSRELGRKVDVKELRGIVKKEVDRLAKDENSWLVQLYTKREKLQGIGKEIEDFTTFQENVGKSAEILDEYGKPQPNMAVIWGRLEIEGRILADVFGARIDLYELYETHYEYASKEKLIEEMRDMKEEGWKHDYVKLHNDGTYHGYTLSDPTVRKIGPENSQKVVKIVGFGSHFVPALPK